MNQDLQFEEGMKRLNEIAEEIRSDKLNLDEIVSLFQESKELSKKLHKQLDEVELVIQDLSGQPIEVLLEDGDNHA